MRCKDCEHFISIHAAREGGDSRANSDIHTPRISIHAAREGGDSPNNYVFTDIIISIHAAREGGDAMAEQWGRLI